MKRILTFIIFLLLGMVATLMATSENQSLYSADALSIADGVAVDLFDIPVPGVAVTGTAEQYAFEVDGDARNIYTGIGANFAPGAIVRNRGSGCKNTDPTWPRYLLTENEQETLISYTWLPGNLLAGSISTRD